MYIFIKAVQWFLLIIGLGIGFSLSTSFTLKLTNIVCISLNADFQKYLSERELLKNLSHSAIYTFFISTHLLVTYISVSSEQI